MKAIAYAIEIKANSKKNENEINTNLVYILSFSLLKMC